MKSIIFSGLFFFCFALSQETIITFHKPYGCELTVEGKAFYFQEIEENLPAFPYDFALAKNQNIYQIQKDLPFGRYGFSVTWKRAFQSKNQVTFKNIDANINNLAFQPPLWCDLKGNGGKLWQKTQETTQKGIEKTKVLGEKGVKKASELLQKAKETLAD